MVILSRLFSVFLFSVVLLSSCPCCSLFLFRVISFLHVFFFFVDCSGFHLWIFPVDSGFSLSSAFQSLCCVLCGVSEWCRFLWCRLLWCRLLGGRFLRGRFLRSRSLRCRFLRGRFLRGRFLLHRFLLESFSFGVVFF